MPDRLESAARELVGPLKELLSQTAIGTPVDMHAPTPMAEVRLSVFLISRVRELVDHVNAVLLDRGMETIDRALTRVGRPYRFGESTDPSELPLSIGLRYEGTQGGHCQVGVFVGRKLGSRGKAGVVTLRVEEWEELAAYAEGPPVDIAPPVPERT
jgi:hypothetical protein